MGLASASFCDTLALLDSWLPSEEAGVGKYSEKLSLWDEAVVDLPGGLWEAGTSSMDAIVLTSLANGILSIPRAGCSGGEGRYLDSSSVCQSQTRGAPPDAIPVVILLGVSGTTQELDRDDSLVLSLLSMVVDLDIKWSKSGKEEVCKDVG